MVFISFLDYGYSEEPHKKNVLGYSPDITSSHHGHHVVGGSTVGSSGAGKDFKILTKVH